jgi:hypothetical protein
MSVGTPGTVRGAAPGSGGVEMGPPLPPDLAPEPGQPLPLLRPLEVGEFLDEAFDLYRRNFRLLFGITLLLDLPLTALQIAFASPVSRLSWADGLALAALPVTFSVLTTALLERIMGRDTTIVAALRKTVRRFLPLFLGLLIYVLAIVVPTAVLILPGALLAQPSPVLGASLLILGLLIIASPLALLSLWGVLLIPVIIAENRGADALARCRRLSAGNLWRLVILSVELFLVMLVLFSILSALRGLLQGMTGINTWQLPDRTNPTELLMYAGITLTEALVLDAVLPISMGACTLAYVDLRIRREALDLELLSAETERRVADRHSVSAHDTAAPSSPAFLGSTP